MSAPAANVRQRLTAALWPPELSARAAVWAILDAARDERIFGAVDGSYLEKSCLYSGHLPWQLQMAAPYLVRLVPEDRLTNMLFDHWGEAWGIYLCTEIDMKSLRRHLRGFLRVRDNKGKRLIFRYYDPRVLRIYLPTCTPDELRTVFGPIQQYAIESEGRNAMLQYSFDGVRLIEESLPLGG